MMKTNPKKSIRLPASALTSGAAAPEFRLPSTPDRSVSLSGFRGAPLILAFYPADRSPVCGDQMTLYTEVRPEFLRFQASLLGTSIDGAWRHDGVLNKKDRHVVADKVDLLLFATGGLLIIILGGRFKNSISRVRST